MNEGIITFELGVGPIKKQTNKQQQQEQNKAEELASYWHH